MIVPDINLLAYATDGDSPHHALARDWLGELLDGRETIGWSWHVLIGYVRIATHPRIASHPIPCAVAVETVSSFLSRSQSTLIAPTSRHLSVLGRLLEQAGIGGNLVSDAHLAALALEHDAALHSADTDFARFPGLRWVNPLAD